MAKDVWLPRIAKINNISMDKIKKIFSMPYFIRTLYDFIEKPDIEHLFTTFRKYFKNKIIETVK
jgi:hypothetical protein